MWNHIALHLQQCLFHGAVNYCSLCCLWVFKAIPEGADKMMDFAIIHCVNHDGRITTFLLLPFISSNLKTAVSHCSTIQIFPSLIKIFHSVHTLLLAWEIPLVLSLPEQNVSLDVLVSSLSPLWWRDCTCYRRLIFITFMNLFNIIILLKDIEFILE